MASVRGSDEAERVKDGRVRGRRSDKTEDGKDSTLKRF